MEKTKCACGKSIPKYYYNSTIRRKQCPSCEYKNKLSGDDKAVKEGLKRKQKKKQKTPRQRAMDRADEWFSKYIRLKHSFVSNGTVFCLCYTCKKPKDIKAIQNGHWRRRGFKPTRFHEDDARPQCVQCNYHRSGEPEIFEQNLITELGIEQVENIRKLSFELGRDDERFYREMADKYRKKFNDLLKEKKIKNPWKTN